MNDRYLYRAKRTDNGEWVEGYYANCLFPSSDVRTGHFIIEYPGEYHEIFTSTICQCTGLKDKNGKLIWENDIVKAWSQGTCAKGKIIHRIDGTWLMYPAWQNGEMWYLLPNENGETTVEVIGNIFDNPELLEPEMLEVEHE